MHCACKDLAPICFWLFFLASFVVTRLGNVACSTTYVFHMVIRFLHYRWTQNLIHCHKLHACKYAASVVLHADAMPATMAAYHTGR